MEHLGESFSMHQRMLDFVMRIKSYDQFHKIFTSFQLEFGQMFQVPIVVSNDSMDLQ
jgi:hypothetical protein